MTVAALPLLTVIALRIRSMSVTAHSADARTEMSVKVVPHEFIAKTPFEVMMVDTEAKESVGPVQTSDGAERTNPVNEVKPV